MPTDAAYSISDLSRLTGLNVRTIRYYIAQGLVPGSGEAGPGAHYGQGHLDRLRLIKRLQAEYLPNAEIRRRLGALSDAEVASLAGEPQPAERSKPETSALDYVRGLLGGNESRTVARAMAAAAVPPPPAAKSMPIGAYRMPVVSESAAPEKTTAAPAETEPPIPERSQWERLSLGPDIELHVRRPLSRQEQRRVERLITIARQVLHEDPA